MPYIYVTWQIQVPFGTCMKILSCRPCSSTRLSTHKRPAHTHTSCAKCRTHLSHVWKNKKFSLWDLAPPDVHLHTRDLHKVHICPVHIHRHDRCVSRFLNFELWFWHNLVSKRQMLSSIHFTLLHSHIQQHTATHTATHCNTLHYTVLHTETNLVCAKLQHSATDCNALQHTQRQTSCTPKCLRPTKNRKSNTEYLPAWVCVCMCVYACVREFVCLCVCVFVR